MRIPGTGHGFPECHVLCISLQIFQSRFLAVSKEVHNDVTLQKLSAEMRVHQTALQWGRDPDGQHAAELTRLELVIEDLPTMKEYGEREKEVSALFQAVDKVISEEAGVDFAINAQHTGCSCGG